MVICAEALLPLAITAIFTTGGPHNSKHAKWGEETKDVLQEAGLRACGEVGGRKRKDLFSRDVGRERGGYLLCKNHTVTIWLRYTNIFSSTTR